MKKLLIIGYVWPEPDSSAAGSRMMQLIDFFLQKKFEIIFASTAAETLFMADLKQMGVKTEAIKLNDPSFDDFLSKIEPEIVIFDRYMMEEQFGWRVSEVCPAAIKILDTEDLHFLRKARENSFNEKISLENALFGSELSKREIASIYRCDLSLIISEFEIELLQQDFKIPSELLFYLPLLPEIPTEEMIADFPIFEDRRNFMSIGNFRHEPNWNAVQHLKESIWPLIRKKLPEAELHIYGAYPSEKVMQLHDEKTGFIIKGWAKDSAEVFKNSRVLLAPLRFGAGLKGKFIDAMRFGTPSVTTSIGAEGINAEFPWAGKIEDDPEDFANAAVALYSQKALWNEAQKNAFEILQNRFQKEDFQNKFWKKLSILKNELEKHRQKNFTGAMLFHHSLQSTRYLSKYIEIKNELARLRK